MALVDKSNVDKVAIPWEDGQWIGLVQLTGPELDEAEDTRTASVVKKWAGVEIKADAKLSDEDKAKQEEERRYSKFDADVLCRHAIRSWSYDAECSAENIALLDAPTRAFIARVIVDRNTRPEASAGSTVDS